MLDGVDLDVEHYTPYYPDFVVQLNSMPHICSPLKLDNRVLLVRWQAKL